MCGIIGVLNLDGSSDEDFSRFKKALKSFDYRGPDHSTTFRDDKILMGHNLLEIVGGKQPLINEDETIILICNGEIYNYKQIKKDLIVKGHDFSSDSDNEAIIHLYEEYGLDMFSRLNGFYSFALWDISKNELILARDPVGKKPLFYSFSDGRIIFSSDIRSLVNYDDMDIKLNKKHMGLYLTLGAFPSPFTALEGVYKLRPGYYLRFNSSGAKSCSHFNVNLGIYLDNLDKNKERFNELFQDSIIRRTDTDKKIGVLLSGGIDSSSVVYHTSKVFDNIDTYSVVFGDIDERHEILDKISVEHNEIRLSSNDIFKLKSNICFLNEPVADPKFLPLLMLSKKASCDVKILMSGDGADELFAGYDYSLKAPVHFSRGSISNDGIKLHQDYDNSSVVNYFKQYDIKGSLLRKAMFFDFKYFLSEYSLPTVDYSTMAASIETRCPYLDREILEFSFKLPDKQLIRSGMRKYLMKEAFKGKLPDSILTKKKEGFSIGLDKADGLFESIELNSQVKSCSYIYEKIFEICKARNDLRLGNLIKYNVSSLSLWLDSVRI